MIYQSEGLLSKRSLKNLIFEGKHQHHCVLDQILDLHPKRDLTVNFHRRYLEAESTDPLQIFLD